MRPLATLSDGGGPRPPHLSEPDGPHWTDGLYSRFREDGWPLCPNCDEDELWAEVDLRAALDESLTGEARKRYYVRRIVGCYRCDWEPADGPKESP